VGELKRKFPKLDQGGRQKKGDGAPSPVGTPRHGKDDHGPADKGKNGRQRGETPPFAGPDDTQGAKTRHQPQGGEQPGRSDEHRERIPGEKAGKPEVKSRDTRAPGQRQTGDENVPPREGDRSERVKKGGDRGEPQVKREAGKKEGAAPARKAKGVWKIKPKDEAPREKEKK
jgi:hypothetical protein